jgi:NitT/TauT family transport system ATP-binding protein
VTLEGEFLGIIAAFSHVERVFANGVKALGALDLEIAEGEFLSLVGPSGCGKSTALRIIAGLIAPTSGAVAWPQGKPRIGFVFQDATLMPWATALDNVRLPLDLQRVPRDEADPRAKEALARVGLAGFADDYPRALSGGMRMRVSIARALVARPQLLLMDEPFAALDEISREALNEDLLKLWREEGLTIVFVTHSVYESTFPLYTDRCADAAPGTPCGRNPHGVIAPAHTGMANESGVCSPGKRGVPRPPHWNATSINDGSSRVHFDRSCCGSQISPLISSHLRFSRCSWA